jgi:predicted nuclease of predicted toxin-antitoxin system
VRLLFDHNLSPRLADGLQDAFPDASHVALAGMDRAFDREVWQYAREHGYTLVSKDADFNHLVTLLGFPPKVVWLRIGNCTTAQAERALRANAEAITLFAEDPAAGLLSIV